jgi:hypothetical protein
MGFVEELKWWHWMVISLLVGAAMAYSATASNDVSGGRKDMDTSSFELNVLRGTFGNDKRPFISNVIIHPPRLVQRGNDLSPMQLVTFDCIILQQDRPGVATSQACQMLAPIPYEPKPRYGLGFFDGHYPGLTVYTGTKGDTLASVAARFYGKDTPEGRAAIISATPHLREAHSFAEMTIEPGEQYNIPWNPALNHTVADFLIEAGKTGTPIKFKNAWWQSEKYAYVIWMSGSFVLLGLIWPTAIQIMLKGGFGRPMQQEYDLSRFKSEPAKPQKQKVGVTAADMQQLHDLEQKMTDSLKSSGGGATVKPIPRSPGGPAPIKKLTGGPVETAAGAQDKKEDKAYRGEFYPVERPTEKPKDPPAST